MLTAIASIFVARILTPVGFGELGIVRSMANMFALYAGFRLGTTASKHVAQYRHTNPDKVARILRLTLVLSGFFCAISALFLLFGAQYLAIVWLDNEALIWPLRLCSVFMFYQSYSAVREEILVGTENFNAFAKVNIVKGILTIFLFTPGAYFWGVSGAIGGLGLAAIGSYFVLSYYIKKALSDLKIPVKVGFSEWKTELPLLWTFALPGLLVGILMVTMILVGKILLIGFEQDGYTQLGQFEAANQWRTVILFVPGIFSRVAMPILAETYERDRDKEFNEATSLQFNIIMFVTLPLTVSVILLSPVLILVFGSSYSDATQIMPVLMASIFFLALNQSLSRVQDGGGRRWQNLAMYIMWAVTFYLVAKTLIVTKGALGLAYAYLVAEILLFVIQLIYVEMRVAKNLLKPVLFPLLLSVVLIAVTIIVSEFDRGTRFYLLSAFLTGVSLVPLLGMYLERKSRARIIENP